MLDYAAKLVQYVLLAVLGGTGAGALVNGGFDDKTIWIGLAVTALGAAATFLKANTLDQPHAKTVVAIFTAGVLSLIAAWTDHVITPSEWVQIIFALIGAVQVGAVKNVGDAYHRALHGQRRVAN